MDKIEREMRPSAVYAKAFSKMSDQELIDHARAKPFSALEEELAARLKQALTYTNEDAQDTASIALGKAFQLGQTYWRQADSEYASQNSKSEETYAKFQKLVEETRDALAAAPAQGQEADRKDAEIESLRAQLAEANKARANDALQMGGVISTMRLERDELIEALGIAQATINCTAKNTPHAFARVVEKYSDEIIRAASKEGGSV